MITLQLHHTSNDSRTLLHIANCTEISHDSHIRYDNPRSPHVGSELDVAHMHGTRPQRPSLFHPGQSHIILYHHQASTHAFTLPLPPGQHPSLSHIHSCLPHLTESLSRRALRRRHLCFPSPVDIVLYTHAILHSHSALHSHLISAPHLHPASASTNTLASCSSL